MSKIIKKDYVDSTAGVWTNACEFEVSDDILNKIEKGKKVLEQNTFLDKVSFSTNLDIKQFDSTLDDEYIKEVEYSNDAYFISDVMNINIHKHGVVLRCWGKWDSSQYFEVYIEE